MRSREHILLLLVLGCLGAAEADPADAMRLPVGSPGLAILAGHWDAEALLGLLADADAQRRRGAARLLRHSELSAARVLDALAAHRDPEVRRLGSTALADRLEAIPVHDLVRLEDAWLAAPLIARHPAEDPLSDPAVAAAVKRWLGDGEQCRPAVSLIIERGGLAGWGRPLVDALAAADARDDQLAVEHCHRGLELLSGTQRSLGPYAGHLELLVTDWHDTLAEHGGGKGGEADAALLELIADLPAEDALLELLEHGPDALGALETAMAGASSTRRRELRQAARLLERAVTPTLYRELGPEALAGMDAEHPRERRALIKRAADIVVAQGDAAGLVHILSYTDDPDQSVRTAAFDRLVRLSDEEQSFEGDWGIGSEDDGPLRNLGFERDGELFPARHTMWRLRRSLREGEDDERVAALTLIATLEADLVREDVRRLLLADSAVVVDSALDTLGHLDLEQADGIQLLRLVEDPRTPDTRRARILDIIAEDARNLHQAIPAQRLRSIFEQATDPLVQAAALKATVAILSRDDAEANSRSLLIGLLESGEGSTMLAAELLEQHASLDSVTALVAQLHTADDPLARRCGLTLLKYLDDEDERSHVQRSFDQAATAALLERSAVEDGAQVTRIAIAIRLGAISGDQALAASTAFTGGDLQLALRHHLSAHALDLEQLNRTGGWLLDAIESGRAAAADEDLISHFARIAARAALLEPRLLADLMEAGGHEIFGYGDTDHSGDRLRKTIQLGDQQLVLEAKRSTDANTSSGYRSRSDQDFTDWTVVERPNRQPTPAQLERTIVLLAAMPMEPGYRADYRDLMLAVLSGEPPATELATTWDRHGELWQVLLHRHPELRTPVVAAIHSEAEAVRSWSLINYFEDGNPDLAKLAIPALAEAEHWASGDLKDYLASLTDDDLQAAVEDALSAEPPTAKLVARSPQILQLLIGNEAPVGIRIIAALLPHHDVSQLAIAPYTGAAQAVLAEALSQLEAEAVRRHASALRRLRAAGAETFDTVLAAQLDADPQLAAAWLRTGIPLEAGMRERYLAALDSEHPRLWLVGAALGLKDGRLDAAGFLERCAALPAEDLSGAAAVARRYLIDDLAAHDAAVAAIIERCRTADLGAWLLLVPPSPATGAAVRSRLADPATARALLPTFELRLRQDREAWRSLATDLLAVLPDTLRPRIETILSEPAPTAD